MFNLFGIKGKIRNCSTNKYGTMNYGVNISPLTRLISLCGIPIGSKPDKKYFIPEWITSNKEFLRAFTNRYFSCEGHVEKDGTISISIAKNLDLLQNGIDFMIQLKQALKQHFDINATNPWITSTEQFRNGRISTRMIVLKICAKKEKLKFYNEIGFENTKKMERLRKALFEN